MSTFRTIVAALACLVAGLLIGWLVLGGGVTVRESEGLTAGDIGEIAGAVFTALAALAAYLAVFRVEKDRRDSRVPDLHVELLSDLKNNEVRLHVVNYGGPAREVNVAGVVGDFGFFGLVGPTTYWRPGESRTVTVAMPPVKDAMVNVLVSGRDMQKQHLVIGTYGGKTYRWPLREARRFSLDDQWHRLFPGVPLPIDVPYTPMDLETIDRGF